jgi:hypothetical protein
MLWIQGKSKVKSEGQGKRQELKSRGCKRPQLRSLLAFVLLFVDQIQFQKRICLLPSSTGEPHEYNP